MEAFLHQQLHPSLFDEMSFLPHQNGELSTSSCFANVYNLSQETSTLSSLEDVMPPHKPQVLSLEKKRKQRDNDESCLTTGQLEGAKESRSRRKKSNGPSEGSKDEKKPKAKEIKATNKEEPPSGYIHVRARRGQATDSHSLAERVRRERISERMKKLQSLVPGCDKVIGKALVLDEIINYVQSLQNQVEFLSMKIASVNSTYDIGVDFEDSLRRPEEMRSISEQTPSMVQNSHFPLTTTFEGAANNIQVTDPSSAAFPLHGHLGSTAFSQDRSSFLMQVEDNRMELLNHVELQNMFCML